MASPSKELITKLLSQYEADKDMRSIPEYLADELRRLDTIQQRLRGIESRKRDAKIEFDKFIQELNAERMQVQNTCKHELLSFNGDPAGGRDSYHECDICGKHI